MKSISNLQELPELLKDYVHVRNKDELLKKINLLIKGGTKKLQIVTDFDHTLTRHHMDDGLPVLTSFGMLRECPSTPQSYKDEDNRLSAIYRPIEANPHMSIEEKTMHMNNWYKGAHERLKGLKFPRQEMAEVARSMIKCFRSGVEDMISWSTCHKVPVLVFSAGLGESVVAALTAAHFLLPNVKVVSNFLKMDDDDTILEIKGEIIHTLNKNETVIKNTEYYDLVKDRSNVILMGDNIGDAKMVEGMDHCDVVIKVGFLGNKIEGSLQNYVSTFDVVLVDDPSVDVINALLKFIPIN